MAITLSISSDEYTVIEMSEEYYNHTKEYISPFALSLSIQEDEKVAGLIKNAPNSIKEIISLSGAKGSMLTVHYKRFKFSEFRVPLR